MRVVFAFSKPRSKGDVAIESNSVRTCKRDKIVPNIKILCMSLPESVFGGQFLRRRYVWNHLVVARGLLRMTQSRGRYLPETAADHPAGVPSARPPSHRFITSCYTSEICLFTTHVKMISTGCMISLFTIVGLFYVFFTTFKTCNVSPSNHEVT